MFSPLILEKSLKSSETFFRAEAAAASHVVYTSRAAAEAATALTRRFKWIKSRRILLDSFQTQYKFTKMNEKV